MKKKLVEINLVIVILAMVAGCKTTPTNPQLNIPQTFNPASLTTYYNNGISTTLIPPNVNLGTSGILVATYIYNGTPYPAIITYSNSNVTFTGNYPINNQFFLVRKPVLQSFQIGTCIVDNSYYTSYQFYQGDTLSFLFNTTELVPWFSRSPWFSNISQLNIGDSIDILKFVENVGNQDLPVVPNSISTNGENYSTSGGTSSPTQVISNTFQTPAIPQQGIVALHIKSPYLGSNQYQINVNLDTNKVINPSWKATTLSTDITNGFLY